MSGTTDKGEPGVISGQEPPVPEPIAIVGIGCVYPQARDVTAYWRNIVDKVDAVSEAPEEWCADLVLDPNSSSNDRVYTNRGGFLKDLSRFDPLRHGVMPNSIDGGEPDQFLALEIAADAVEDAQFDLRPVDGDRVAVILGRGTYINRGFVNVLQHGFMVDRFLDILKTLHPDTTEDEAAHLKAELKASLPPFNAEMAPALVPNLVTGRISNRLDFRGANYIIDAACASSLIAMERGVADLRAGSCDMALVGGVHASTPAPIYQIFSQLGALSHKGNIRPFSEEADGTLLAEGVGILAIKRLSDAEAAGDRIYALVRGCGVASDGKGMSILAPRLDGERRAIRRAYENAQVDPATVGLIEAHGTATTVGDATEIEALTEEFGMMTSACALGTVKSMIGHCLPASGSAGMIKVALALHHRVLPPTLVDTANADLGIDGTGFYLNTEARPWIHGRSTPRRAGVNAFGFGGINAHVVLEEYTGGQEPQSILTRTTELIAFDAPDRQGALTRLDEVAAALRAAPDLATAASTLNGDRGSGTCRMAVVADSLDGALVQLEALRKGLEKGRARLRDRRGAYFSCEPLAETGKVAFLFPGEGSQYRNMLLPHMLHFPAMRHWFDLVDGAYGDDSGRMLPSEAFFPPPLSGDGADDIWRMDVGPEAIFAANMAVATLYHQIGLTPDMMVGHSTGEYAALYAAGATARTAPEILQKEIRDLNAVFAAAEVSGDIAHGTLFTIGPVNAESLRARIGERDDVFLGMDNCPHQQVVATTSEAGAAWVEQTAKELRAFPERLPFARAYHCPAFRPFSDRLAGFLGDVEVAAPRLPVWSCLTAAPFPDDPMQIRTMMADQWAGEVRFTDTIRSMYEDGARIFVECGPRNNLTSFVDDILRKQKHLCVAADTTARSGLEQLHHMAALLLVEGVPLDLDALGSAAPMSSKGAGAQPLKMGLQPMALSDKPRPKRPAAPTVPAAQAPRPEPAPTPSPQVSTAPDPMQDLVAGYFDTMNKIIETEQQVMMAYLQSGGTAGPNGDEPVNGTTGPLRFPMLSQIQAAPDGRSLEARIDVNHALSPYLTDHSFGRAVSVNDPTRHGLSVVPLTFTMEALAEAAAALRPDLVVTGLREVRGSRWISVEKPQTTSLQVTAELIEDGAVTRIRTRIRDAEGPLIRPVIAETEVELAAHRAPAPEAPTFAPTSARPSNWTLADVYSRIMFHGPRLQAVESMDLVAPDACDGGLIGMDHSDLFTATRQPMFETDAITLDAIGQLVGVWSADQLAEAFHIFPFRVERVEIFRDNLTPGEQARCRCEIALVGADEMRSDIYVLSADGRLQSRIIGWWDKRFDLPEPFFAARLDPARNALSVTLPTIDELPGVKLALTECLSDDLLDGSGGIWAGVLGGLILSDAEATEWRALAADPMARFAWIRERAALKDVIRAWRGTELYPADLTINKDATGQSAVATGWPVDWGAAPVISVASAAEQAVAIAADPGTYEAVGVAVADMAGAAQAVAPPSAQSELALLPPDARQRNRVSLWLHLAKQAASCCLDNTSPRGLSGTQYDFERRLVTLQDSTTQAIVTAHMREDAARNLTIAVVAQTHR